MTKRLYYSAAAITAALAATPAFAASSGPTFADILPGLFMLGGWVAALIWAATAIRRRKTQGRIG